MANKATVGDYVTLVRGVTYKGNLVGKPGPALLGLGSIQPGGGFRNGDYKTYGGECPPKFMLYPGDLFVSLKGATKDGKMIGSVARVPPSVGSGRLTQDTVKLVFDEPSRDFSNFIYWILRTPQYRDYCAGRAMGSAVVALSREDFLSFPVPDATACRKVLVGLLEAIEEKVANNGEMNETLAALAQTLFKNWFADAAATKLPKGWREGTVSEIANLSRDGINPGDFPDELFAHYSIPAFDEGKSSKQEKGDTIKSNKFIVPPECVMVSKLNPRIPRIWMPEVTGENRAVCSTEFLVAIPQAGASREFLYCQFSDESFVNKFATMVTGTSGSHQRVKPESLLAMDVIIPSATAMQEFTDIVAPMLQRIIHNIAESRTLAELRDALLPKLLSGELRVPTKLKEAVA
jgi:restriction endonuclease S subunit